MEKKMNKQSDICYFCKQLCDEADVLAKDVVLLTCPDGVDHYCHVKHHGVTEEAIKQNA